MNEEFLHYIWKYRLLNSDLRIHNGESLVIVDPGEHNRNAGPDFLNARVKIGSTLWAGNVEMHIHASDWFRHQHQFDSAYDNIILHVVHNDDMPVRNGHNIPVPTLEIYDQYPPEIFEKYEDFIGNHNWIPCEKLIHDTDPFHFIQWSPALMTERLEDRCKRFAMTLENYAYDWDETFYFHLAHAFGFRINATPFEMLAHSLPLKILLKHKDNLFQLESLLFGQSGMLINNFSSEYPRQLDWEYQFLKHKYGLQPLNPSIWKFLRLRPSNFPTIRIAQLAMCIYQSKNLLARVLHAESTSELVNLFSVRASDYWNDYFLFDKLSTHRHKILGPASVHLLLLNLVIPFIFFYGDYRGISDYKEKGLQMLEELPGEMNSELGHWKALGLPVFNAMQTQSLIQLKEKYCDLKKCLECRIGIQLLPPQNRS
ncbi:MAG: DUF2851 family protein [Bacteroidota bacterium]|nr:DUF2851 family protein [Bacteroidota bacterium]